MNIKKHEWISKISFTAVLATLFFWCGSVTFALEEPRPGVQVFQQLDIKQGDTEASIQYCLFLPESYKETKAWPLMLFLHGAGERGDNLELVKKWGPAKHVDKDKKFPFVVVSPQCPKGIFWNATHLYALVEHIAKTQKIDRSRIYCTGLSMGGYGTWALVAKYPKLFAAAVPICGGGNPATAERLIDIPIWAFHGDKDNVVPASKSTAMVEAIKKLGGEKAKLTIYPGVNHNSWSQTYANKEVYDWLLSHRAKRSDPKK